jgi:AraC-like DNA-binding protein
MQFCEFLLRKSPAYPDSRTRLSDVLHAKACTFTRRFTHTTEEVAHMPNIRHVISAGSCLALAYRFLCSVLIASGVVSIAAIP